MTRITSQSPSTSPAVIEAGRRFQLPPRTEKRTQGSTLFSTTAKSVTSSVPFRWRADQVKIFEDWILFKGPNVMSADLLPLLRALDLDGYEDVKNYRGECVHDLIIVKVRRKLTRTKNIEVEGKRACDTSQATHTQHLHAASVTSPPRANVRGQVRESAYGEDNETIVKREQGDEYHVAPGGYHYKPPAVSNIAPPTPVRMSRPSIYQNIVPPSASGKDNATTMPNSPAALTPGGELRTGQGQSIQRTASRYGLHSQVVPRRSTSDTDLLAGINKLKAAIKEFSLTVDQLRADSATAFLDTAAHDTKLDIEYLEDLVREYLRD